MELHTQLFFLNIALILTHELDAIREEEWRFFLSWTGLDDTTAYRIFTAVHIPLAAWFIANANARPFQIGFDLFLIIHLGLHLGLRNHPLIRFRNRFSQAIIVGAAVGGAAHLLLTQ